MGRVVARSKGVLQLARERTERQRASAQRLIDHGQDRGAVVVREDDPCGRYVHVDPSSAITAHRVHLEMRGLRERRPADALLAAGLETVGRKLVEERVLIGL